MAMLSMLKQIDILRFIKWNYLKSNIKRDKGAYLIPYRHSTIDIDKSANVLLHANIHINPQEVNGTKKEAILFVRPNGRLVINGAVRLLSGATLQVQQNASIDIGQAS